MVGRHNETPVKYDPKLSWPRRIASPVSKCGSVCKSEREQNGTSKSDFCSALSTYSALKSGVGCMLMRITGKGRSTYSGPTFNRELESVKVQLSL